MVEAEFELGGLKGGGAHQRGDGLAKEVVDIGVAARPRVPLMYAARIDSGLVRGGSGGSVLHVEPPGGSSDLSSHVRGGFAARTRGPLG